MINVGPTDIHGGGSLFESLGFSADAEAVYLAMLSNPEWTVAMLATSLELTERQVRTALDELVDMALLRPSLSEPHQMRPVSPGTGFAALLTRAEAETERRQQQLQATRAALSAAIANFHDGREPEPIVRLPTVELVRERLADLAANAATECLSLNPGRAHSAGARSSSALLNQAALQRGVAIRSIYQDSVRNDPQTFEYAQWLTGLGAQIRSTPAIPMIMVIVDRRVALIPIDPFASRQGALEIGAPGVVAVALAYFEQSWSAAMPLAAVQSRDSDGLTAQERELLDYMSAGHTDEMAARKLDVSLRTVRRLTADLMERLGARSRFQAGIAAARRGWLDPL